MKGRDNPGGVSDRAGDGPSHRGAERGDRNGEPNRNDRTGRINGATDDADELIGTAHGEIKLPPPRYQFLPGGVAPVSFLTRSSLVPHPGSCLVFRLVPLPACLLRPVFSSSHPVFSSSHPVSRYRLVPPSRSSSRRGVSSPVSFLVCLLVLRAVAACLLVSSCRLVASRPCVSFLRLVPASRHGRLICIRLVLICLP